MRRNLLLSVLAVAMTAQVSGCGDSHGKAGCVSDMQCEMANAATPVCMMGTCLPRGVGRQVAVEILPKLESASARTGLASVTVGPDAITLVADDRVVVSGTVTDAPDAHVILLAPSAIPGQSDLQFETDLTKTEFQVGVGRTLLQSTAATVWLIPGPQTPEQPPTPFSTQLDSTLTFMFPANTQMTVIRGRLLDPLDAPQVGFSARASVGAKVVSSVSTTDDTGLFHLLIAPGAVPADGMVTFEFTKPDSPRFVTKLLPLVLEANAPPVRVLRLPALIVAAPLRFIVRAGDADGRMLPDVNLRFRTEIPALDGTAIYEREERTNGMGEIEVPLIPGTATEARNYQITILPPPDSGYASRCVSQQPVTIVGSDTQSQYSATFTLEPKVTLQGNVFGSDGAAGSNVNVTATPLATNPGCATATTPISSTTLRNGHYQILLDPGSYRLDIDPPIGAPQPRLTEDGDRSVLVSSDAVTNHDVVLPAGEVIVGTATGSDGTGLGAASLKFFEVLCQDGTCSGAARIPPALRSQTRTDSDGLFRAVLPIIQ